MPRKITRSTYNLLYYFLGSLVFMELVLRSTTTGGIFSMGLLISLFFSSSIAVLLFLITSFFNKILNHTLAIIFLAISSFIFSTQLVYYQFFRTFYHLYSAGNASQVTDFWRDILLVTFKNLHLVLLLFTPTLLLFALGKRWFSFSKLKSTSRLALALLLISTHFVGVATVYAGGKHLHSAYDLYYKSSNPVLSIQNLGLLTTMRIDLQRLITGWTPILDVYLPEPGDSSDDDDNTDVERGYNILNIDFDYLIANESNEQVRQMHEYFSRLQPTTKNDYTGIFEGYNLILITAESLAPYAINKDVTPTLYKMVHEGFNFTNFYVPLWDVSTTDGEYMGLTGLIPKAGVWSFRESASIDLPFVMGNQLKNLDYKTVAYHNHTYTYYRRNLSHPNMGYDYKGIGNGLNVKAVWPASDLEMMEVTIPEYINHEPFHAYYMTVSGHLQYNFFGNNMAMKNRHYVEDLPLSTQARAYLATQIELDRALEHLLDQLEEAGIAERTLIVMSTDHYPYGLDHETIDELSGHHVDRNFDLHKSPLIMYVKGMEPKTIDTPAWGVDIVPTISNLLGLDYDSRLFIGRDIFSDSDPLVIFRNHSFITDKGRYNSVTREFTPNPGVLVDNDYVEKISRIINNKFYFSTQILDNDYYSKVLKALIEESMD